MVLSNLIKSLWTQFYLQTLRLAPKIVSGFFIFLGFWLAGLTFKTFIYQAGRKLKVPPDLIRLFSRSAQIIAIILGAITGLGTIGVDMGALIAGLGLSS